MALHKNLPESPYAILDPALRWFPADESLRETRSEKLMPPLVSDLGGVLRDLGDHAGARAAFERALGILEKFLPPDHPNIRLVRRHLEGLRG